jgi:hypothetical protein
MKTRTKDVLGTFVVLLVATLGVLCAMALAPALFTLLVFLFNALFYWGFGWAWLGLRKTVTLGIVLGVASWFRKK